MGLQVVIETEDSLITRVFIEPVHADSLLGESQPSYGVLDHTLFSPRKSFMQEDFDKAAKDALTLPASTTDESKLILYGLFKQATVGDVNTTRPGFLDPKGKAKWDAWKKLEGKSKESAQQDYITKVTQLAEEA